MGVTRAVTAHLISTVDRTCNKVPTRQRACRGSSPVQANVSISRLMALSVQITSTAGRTTAGLRRSRRRRCGVSQAAIGWSTSSSLGSFRSLASSRSQRFDARRCKAGRSSLIARDAPEQPARRHCPANARAPPSGPLRGFGGNIALRFASQKTKKERGSSWCRRYQKSGVGPR
jgi:hypothetical protein